MSDSAPLPWFAFLFLLTRPLPKVSAIKLEKLWFLHKPPSTQSFLVSHGQETSVVSTPQNQALPKLRAKGTVAPLDLSTINYVPWTLNCKLVAAWVLLVVAGGQAPGYSRYPQGPVLPVGSLAPEAGCTEQS